ncbi:MAG: helix-turn-helix domain-containing protein [Solirubrobacteraceae bacterium]
MKELLLTLDEAAERVRLSPWTLRRAIKRGELHCYRPAGRIRIPERSLDAWLASTSPEPSLDCDLMPAVPIARLTSTPESGADFRARLRKRAS